MVIWNGKCVCVVVWLEAVVTGIDKMREVGAYAVESGREIKENVKINQSTTHIENLIVCKIQ